MGESNSENSFAISIKWTKIFIPFFKMLVTLINTFFQTVVANFFEKFGQLLAKYTWKHFSNKDKQVEMAKLIFKNNWRRDLERFQLMCSSVEFRARFSIIKSKLKFKFPV